ncbi:MAG TPA: Zn-binding domain-containing protein, partial [Candidatus Dormibacteraeota bacterium]|nr:Zn-binding domain-containing protein [Candidatus Dormibacteraeota bacterium]
LGMQIDMHVDEREIEQFVVVSQPPTGPEVTLAYYDTLPGGTGYLARLFERLPEVAATARRHLAECPCERACYRCLMQFWNQRDHQVLDKRLVLPALGMLAEGVATAPAPAMSQRELFDSVVESTLFERLRAEGLPRPSAGRDNVLRDASGMGILQMDLSWPDRRLLVLLDGREFHATTAEQVLTDEDKRNRAIAAGWTVLEFTGWEVVHRLGEVVTEIHAAVDGRPTLVEFLVMPPVSTGLAVAAEGGVRLLCSEVLPPALARLEAAGFGGAGRVQAAGLEMEALALRQDPPAVVLGVDSRAWLADAGAWRRQLRLMRQLGRAGVRCFRLPLERLDDPAGLRHALELMGL